MEDSGTHKTRLDILMDLVGFLPLFSQGLAQSTKYSYDLSPERTDILRSAMPKYQSYISAACHLLIENCETVKSQQLLGMEL